MIALLWLISSLNQIEDLHTIVLLFCFIIRFAPHTTFYFFPHHQQQQQQQQHMISYRVKLEMKMLYTGAFRNLRSHSLCVCVVSKSEELLTVKRERERARELHRLESKVWLFIISTDIRET